jgi:hypothetical protein
MDLKLTGTDTGGDQLRMVTESAAGPDFAFIVGETWLIKAEDRRSAPDALLNNSEPVSLALRTPFTRVFDAAWFAKMTQPRPEPPPMRWLSADEICAEKVTHWTPRDVQRAIATAGFPKAHGTRAIGRRPDSVYGRVRVVDPHMERARRRSVDRSEPRPGAGTLTREIRAGSSKGSSQDAARPGAFPLDGPPLRVAQW